MSKFTQSKKYRCTKCNDLHSEHYDALECCEPEEITIFNCNVCNEEFTDFKPSYHKCDEGALFNHNQRELEKNGQLRFV